MTHIYCFLYLDIRWNGVFLKFSQDFPDFVNYWVLWVLRIQFLGNFIDLYLVVLYHYFQETYRQGFSRYLCKNPYKFFTLYTSSSHFFPKPDAFKCWTWHRTFQNSCPIFFLNVRVKSLVGVDYRKYRRMWT